MDKAFLEAMSPTLGNLSELAGGRSDCRHLLEPFGKKKASSALAGRRRARYLCIGVAYTAYSGARSLRCSSLDKAKRDANMQSLSDQDHHEGWRTLWLTIAGVMAITLTWNVLMVSLNGISY
jgi:hypothetical protein